jgi:hypothetical protein
LESGAHESISGPGMGENGKVYVEEHQVKDNRYSDQSRRSSKEMIPEMLLK